MACASGGGVAWGRTQDIIEAGVVCPKDGQCTGGPVLGWGLGLLRPCARQGRLRPQLRAWSKREGNKTVEMGAEAWSDPFSRWVIRAERCEQVSLMEPSLHGTGQRGGGRWLLGRGWSCVTSLLLSTPPHLEPAVAVAARHSTVLPALSPNPPWVLRPLSARLHPRPCAMRRSHPRHQCPSHGSYPLYQSAWSVPQGSSGSSVCGDASFSD